MSQSELNDFSNEEVVDWITKNFPGKGQIKEDLITKMKDNEITGSDLTAAQSSDDLVKELKLSKIAARKLFTSLSKAFPNEIGAGKKAANTVSRINALMNASEQKLEARKEEEKKTNNINGNINSNINGDKKFQVSIFVGNKRKLTKNYFTINSSVRDLKREIAENEAGGNPTGCDVRLIYNGNSLVDDKTLGYYRITNSSCFITAVIRLAGGASGESDIDEKKEEGSVENGGKQVLDNGKNSDTRERIAHFKGNKNITATLEPDCVTLEDSQNELRVKMPCGHVFSPLTIFKWCQRTLEVYSKSEVCCPMLKCNKKWEIKDIVSAADLDEHEHGSLVNILSRRELMQSGDVKECPECETLIELPDKLNICRVRCTSKACQNKSDFCWLCNKSWKGNGMGVCGNKDCHSTYINDQLKIENCGTTTEIMGRNDVKCPTLRACPRCLSITEYKKDCKHMVCWNCKRSFCFICLALAGKEVGNYGQNWACEGGDDYDGKCKLAPVQVLT